MSKNQSAAKPVQRKMKEVSGGVSPVAGFVNPKNLEVGDELSGIYRGNFTAGKFNSTTHKIEVEQPTAAIDADGKEITLKAGELAGISGGGQLNARLADVADGTFVSIIYTGKQKINTKGHKFEGSLANTFKVSVEDLGSDPADASDDEEGSL